MEFIEGRQLQETKEDFEIWYKAKGKLYQLYTDSLVY